MALFIFRRLITGELLHALFYCRAITIGKNGVEVNIQKVFLLGSSASLRVVDERNRAVFLPQPTTSDAGAEARYSFAYALENGHCNFKKQVSYPDAFPGYSQPVWLLCAVHNGLDSHNKYDLYDHNIGYGSDYNSTLIIYCGDGGSPDGPDSSGSPSTEPSKPIKPKPDPSPGLKPQPGEPQASQPQQPPQESTQPKLPAGPPAAPRPNEEGTPGVHEDEDGADEEDGQDASDHPSNSSGSPHQGGTGPGGQEQTHDKKPDGATSGPNHSEQDLPDDQKPGGTRGLEPPNPAGGKVPSDNNKLKPPRPSETPALQNTRAATPNIRST
ncbi:Toxoplasma gondii family A protein, partial [Toxoplasma gondii RUB]